MLYIFLSLIWYLNILCHPSAYSPSSIYSCGRCVIIPSDHSLQTSFMAKGNTVLFISIWLLHEPGCLWRHLSHYNCCSFVLSVCYRYSGKRKQLMQGELIDLTLCFVLWSFCFLQFIIFHCQQTLLRNSVNNIDEVIWFYHVVWLWATKENSVD